MLDCAACTATQRLTGPEGATVLVRAMGLPVAVADVVDGFGVAVELVVADADADGAADPEPLGWGVPVAGALVDAGGLAGALVEPLGVGVGVEPLGVGVGVGVGVELGDDVGGCSGWHCCTAVLAVVTALVSSAAWVASAAMENPVTVAASTPPATNQPTTGCTCAIRMKGPARAVRCLTSRCLTSGTSPRCPIASAPLPSGAQPDREISMIDRRRTARSPVSSGNVTLSDACHVSICWVRGIGRAYPMFTHQ